MASTTSRFIYFDLGNVLLTFDHRTACEQIGQLTGLSADRVWSVLFESKLQEHYEQGLLSSAEMYEQFCRACFPDRKDWPDYDAFHLANSDIFQWNVPIVAIVAHLHAAGHPLGILSNTCEAHWNHVTRRRFQLINRAFRETILSYEQRMSKPDRGIYEIAVQRAGAEPNEVFFVDDRAENVDGACRAGLDAVLFEGPGQLASDLRSRGVRFNY